MIEEEEEEEFEEDEVQDQSATELINVLHGVHCDNSKLQYYAMRPGGGRGERISIMPVTPFVYEFFLFNSLYQVDWETTKRDGRLVFHSEDDCGESKKQRSLLSYLKGYSNNSPENLYRAFEPLLYIEAEGAWTKVKADARITEAQGDRFFRNIGDLKSLLSQCRTPSDMPSNKKTFDILKECTYFVYLVRNNIFHGSKTLGEVYEPSQKRRLEIYDLFLKGVTSLFFLASGKDVAACDYVPCPLYAPSLSTTNPIEIMDQQSILDATANSMMKIGDSRLVAQFRKLVPSTVTRNTLSDRSSLFYPSAGTDFITPILLGLPYCTQFYFFDIVRRKKQPPALGAILRQIKGVRLSESSRWNVCEDSDCLDFEYDGVPRRIHWVHADNVTIFKKDIELCFYFHRGDSSGEGGSGQEWDSKHIPDLTKMIPSGSSAIYVTDGIPGGFKAENAIETFALNLPFIERGRTYFCGRLSSASNVPLTG